MGQGAGSPVVLLLLCLYLFYSGCREVFGAFFDEFPARWNGAAVIAHLEKGKIKLCQIRGMTVITLGEGSTP